MKKLFQLLALVVALLGFALPSSAHAAPKGDEAAQIETYLNQSKFNQYQKLVLGDPLASLKTYADLPRKANLPRYVASLAGVLITLGFALSLWRAAVTGSEAAMKGAFMNMIVSSALLAGCFNYANGEKTPWSFSAIMFNSWGTTYDWSRRTFARDMDLKIEEAQQGMYALMSQVVASASLVALPGGAGVAMRTTRSMALAAKGAKLEAGVKAASVGSRTAFENGSLKAGGNVLGRLNFAMAFMEHILMAYSFVVTVTGLLILACIYVLPIGFAAINFGSTRILWSVFGTFLACWFSILLLPLFLAVSLNKTFIEPVKAMNYYTQNLAVERNRATTEAQGAAKDVQTQATQSVEKCKNAPPQPAATLDSEPCAELRGGGWVEKLLNGMTDVLTQRLGVISDIFNGIVNTIASAFWGLATAVAGMLMSIGIMVATPGRFASLLGGIAEQMRGK